MYVSMERHAHYEVYVPVNVNLNVAYKQVCN